MDGGSVCPALAQAMISEGRHQLVQIDHRTLLKKVMAALGSNKPPIYTVFDCGSKGYRVSIKLDVSSTRYSVGKQMNVAVVESENYPTQHQAEKVAVTNAFKLLNERHLIKIKDFSSRLICEMDANSAFGYINSALYSLEKMVEQWEIVMKKCTSISVQLAGKEAIVGTHGDASEPAEYGDLNQFMKMTLDMFKRRVEDARARATDLECERKKYHNRCTERYHAALRKGYLQDVIVEAKEVLDYVLTYIGAGKATYTNGPTDSGIIKAVVTFNVPEIPDVDICGNLTIRGKATRSMDAEEAAAFEALKYIENKFNIKIVDLNHAERVTAEKEHKFLVTLLEKTVHVADEVKVNWEKMVKSVATEKSAYPLDAKNFGAGQSTAKKEAYIFCSNCIDELDNETSRRFADCTHRFQEMQKMQCKVEEMKIDMGMD